MKQLKATILDSQRKLNDTLTDDQEAVSIKEESTMDAIEERIEEEEFINDTDSVHNNSSEKSLEILNQSDHSSSDDDMPPSPTILSKTTRKDYKSLRKERRIKSKSEEASLENIMKTMDLLNCYECKSPSTSLRNLFSHFRTVHNNPKGFIFCCDRKKIGRSNAFDHIRVHLDEDAFKCLTCAHRYPNKWSLDYHTKQVHTLPEDRDFMCDVCGKTFANKPGFDDHVKYHTRPEDRPHKCPVCAKGFTTPFQVKRHIARLHDKSGAFICDQCGRGFGSPSLLSTHHYKVHRDRKMDPLKKGCKYIQCSKCDKRVSERNYQAHVANNCFQEGVDMVCIVCERVLKTPKSLKAHMRSIHPDRENGETCPHCPVKPATAGNRIRHIKNTHPEEFEKLKYTVRDE